MKEDKILVEIPAYCDHDLINTVQSAIVQADNPDRVHFAICYQDDDLTDLKLLQKIKNCKIKHLKKSEAKGTCYARYLCQKMIEDEKYVYQTDSHMRFTKGWDTKMIEQLLSLKDPKATISYYPPQLKEEFEKLPVNDKVFNMPSSTKPMIIVAKKFREDSSYFLYPTQKYVEPKPNGEPLKSPFISANNFFSFAEIHKTIFHNPKMFWFGDELPMAIRYYTHGWNNYCPNESYIYHRYMRKDRTVPRTRKNGLQEEELLMEQLIRNKTKDEYGLGKERTIKQFEDYAGIDFTKKIVYMKAEIGNFEDNSMQNRISFLQSKELQKKKLLRKKEKIEIIVIDLQGKYQKSIESCLKNKVKNDVEFIVGTVNQFEIDEKMQKQNHIKKIIYFDKNDKDTHYSMMLSKLTKYLSNCYTAIIDSSFRFAPEWDKKICETIKDCGENSAITCWVTRANNNNTNIFSYLNAVKIFDKFNDYLPTLKFRTPENYHKGKYPCKTPFIAEGFLFCSSKILKKIKPDPNLSYNEQKYIYAARLWTSGIDLYYSKSSCFVRMTNETELDNGTKHYDVLCGLMGRNNRYSAELDKDYKYTLGDARPLWGWYDFIGYNYDNDPELTL
ncbi:hypothetical protein IKT18_02530 [Candidatus Saccharibacteria bacterium]|nr:hypothetical protein [Candidatus Saccharibacteria bacterium]